MKRWIAALVSLVAGCSSGNYVECDRPTTGSMELKRAINGRSVAFVEVHAEGKDTVLDFNGHVYVFRGRTGHSGLLTFEEADLCIADLSVRVDGKGIRIQGPSFTISGEHLSGDRRRIIEGQSFLID